MKIFRLDGPNFVGIFFPFGLSAAEVRIMYCSMIES
jgi:hypothetical protein